MNRAEEEQAVLAPLRELPPEVSLEQVRDMVAAFPLGMGAVAWLIHTLKFNLNTLLMTSIGTLLLGTGLYLFSGSTPAATPVPNGLPRRNGTVVRTPAVPAATVTAATPTLPRPEQGSSVVPAANRRTEDLRVETETEAPKETPGSGTPVQEATAPMPEPTTVTTGVANERIFNLSGFKGIALRSSSDVRVEEGEFAVVAKGEQQHLDMLDIKVDQGILSIEHEARRRMDLGMEKVLITVRLPRLDQLIVHGSGSIHVAEFKNTPSLQLSVMGSGDIDMAGPIETTEMNIQVQGSGDVLCAQLKVISTTTIDLMGSGNVQVAGTTDRILLNIMGSGDVHAENLKAGSGKVNLMGSGDAYLDCSGHLESTKTGSGTIHNTGSAGRERSRGVTEDEDR